MPEFDVLVIGGGASGLRAAIAAKRTAANVALITKTHPLRTNSAIAQGGLNAPLGKDDSPPKRPEPPQPAPQLDELFCDWLAFWLVVASFDADESAELLRSWLAELFPPDT